jgi:hypothetical protein
MATRRWTVRIDGRERTIELRHGYWTQRRTVTVDGERVLDIRADPLRTIVWSTKTTEHAFALDGQRLAVRVRPGWLFYELDLVIEGRSVTTGGDAGPLPPAKWFSPRMRPFWVAVFVLAFLVGFLGSFVKP